MSCELPCQRAASAVDVNQWAFVAHEIVARGAGAVAAAARAPRPPSRSTVLAAASVPNVPQRPGASGAARSARARRTASAPGAATRRLRVVLADDDHLFAAALKAVLAESDQLDVVGCARNGAEAVSLVTALQPDLALLDLHMPILDGLGAMREILRTGHTRVVLVTGESTAEHAERARELGATAVFEKALGLDELATRVLRLTV